MTLRSAFAQSVFEEMEENDRIIVLLGDIGVFSFKRHAERWPSRVLNAGIAECGMVSLAAGLAVSGFYPIVSTISAFLTRRAYEFIRLDFGEQKLPGLFVGIGGAHEYSKLGNTHCCPEHMSLMGFVPGMHCVSPTSQQGPLITPELRVGYYVTRAIRERALVYMSLEESS